MAELVNEIRSTVQVDTNGRQVGQMTLDGLAVTLYRSEIDGVLVVEVGSADVEEEDQHEDAVPRLRVFCNDGLIMGDELGQAGGTPT